MDVQRGVCDEVLNETSRVAVIIEDFCIPPWSRSILVEPLSSMNPIIFVT